jgi:hypothetical protein
MGRVRRYVRRAYLRHYSLLINYQSVICYYQNRTGTRSMPKHLNTPRGAVN